ncbi:hypothetical protein ANN_23136 [Periplaneta americana]|uniref:Uncharacterized protein n=1 Tax=Periplaneta americana TaxID=6978 RepID=A0ABQ8SK91_PERAM|nr:hypothetical protein ANN_23136 [Periplaneta americana]
MAGLCEGGNEPPGSLKAKSSGLKMRQGSPRRERSRAHIVVRSWAERNDEVFGDSDAEPEDAEQKNKLAGSLAEKKLSIEGCTGRNGEREKSSGQKKISDDRRH